MNEHPQTTSSFSLLETMICNIFGKAVTKSTLLTIPEYAHKSDITQEDLARVALPLKNSQWKDKDEEEARRYVERLTDQSTQDNNRSTVGWIYNASGSAITLVGSRDWEGGLASSSLYPVRIENGQWGVFLHQQTSSESSGSVLYNCGSDLYWCVAWMNKPSSSSPQVHVCLERKSTVPKRIRIKERNFVLSNYLWSLIKASLERFETHQSATQNGLFSVISSSPGPHVVFEALLTMENVL